jgi:hypothetical protein
MLNAAKRLNGGVVALVAMALTACAASAAEPPAKAAPGAPPAAATTPPATAPAGAKRTAEDIQMAEILDSAPKKAILAKHAPDLASNPQLEMARGMTLAQVAMFAGLTPEVVAAIIDDISQL